MSLLLAVFCSPAVAAGAPSQPLAPNAAHPASPALNDPCRKDDTAEVVIYGKSSQRYRIDKDVLAAGRAVEALPAKPEIDATKSPVCIGPNCGGGMIPLVGVAFTAMKAVTLAAQGDDWREAFRTHPDEYAAYQRSKAKGKGGISIGVSAGN